MIIETVIKRTLIILAWIGLLFVILYLPNWRIVSPTAKSLNIFTWGDILEPSIIADFEKKTGITVHLNYYSSNEELLVKLRATEGFGYDLILPSDYAVKILAQEGLLKELDHSALPFYTTLNPLLLGHSFDRFNRYSIPFAWELFGLGIDKGYFETHPLDPSWDLIFTPNEFNIAMVNDPVEVMALTAFFLKGKPGPVDSADFSSIQELLIRQKKWVEAYASFRGDYFIATKNCPVVVSTSSYIRNSMKQFPFIGFALPKEGTFITIENLCIPKASSKSAQAYQFINHLFSQASIKAHYDRYGFFPSTVTHLTEIEPDADARALIFSSPETFSKYHFIENVVPEQTMHDMWIAIKTSET